MTHLPISPRAALFAALVSLLTVSGVVLASSCRAERTTAAAKPADAVTPAVPGGGAGAPPTPAVSAGADVAAPGASGTARVPAHAEGAGYEFRAAERDAVERYLEANPDLRVARDADQRPAEEGDVSNLYGVYHPYFVRGDANDDGILDFVLAFVRRDSDHDSPWFSVVVFEGRPDGTFSPGSALERDISLADGDLSLDRDSIVVTPDTSEDASRRYRWDPARQRHVFVRDEDEAPETPPSSQT
jgi:hypothetical protein